ncbi:hypothetical protein RMR16_002640 [Agrobacterium sp. rho-13.3]|jgi:hypothetical protein|uniref:hypothetical protein n=1 Tax=Agrobacterium sp. rho-13.3 TaxID=3072980 RepID=UPI002A10E3F6|nr:hypothetical protein [Agrobacterium sp. rho-13.3]MDX8308703.1 hypothetical protein [Agrobacterium sp. rho-13.3]
MENYSVWADLLHTFRMMSDSVKVLLIYMPGVFALSFAALYLYHLRQHVRPARQEPQPYTILPPEKPAPREHLHPRVETMRNLDSSIRNVERVTGNEGPRC